MTRTKPVGLWALALAMTGVLGGLGLWKGGLYMDWYEGDVLHLIEIVMRMADGQRPHQDFMTPIGVLATWPFVVFIQAGLGVGMAIHAAQIALALVLMPAVVRAGSSRFSPGLAYLFVAAMMVLPLALVHGGTEPNISLSMHYNRWAWALSLVALTLAVLPPRGAAREGLDGALIGVLLAAVVLIKVTYVVALLPGIIAALLLRGALRALLVGLATGVAVLAAATLALGLGFWPAYVQDLLTTALSEVRSYPSLPFGAMVTAPMLLGAHLLALLAVVLLRQGKQRTPGLVLLLVLPGLVYVTFQNFGNDPQWVIWLGLVLFMWRPETGLKNHWGCELRPALGLVAAALVAVGSASFLNLAYSPFRHATVNTQTFAPFFPRSAQHGDFQFPAERAMVTKLQIDGGTRFAGFATGSAHGNDAFPLAVLNGETLPNCTLLSGLIAWFDLTARQLETAGFADGSQIMVADLLSNLPLFSDRLNWVVGDAPWRYDGLPGLASADYVLVPLCNVVPRIRQMVLAQLADKDVDLTEVLRTDLFILLKNGAKS